MDLDTFEITVGLIPPSNRKTIDLLQDPDDPLKNSQYVRHSVFLLCLFIRDKSTHNGERVVGGKRVIAQGVIKSHENLVLITFNNGNTWTQVILALHDLYVYAVFCNGRWLYSMNNLYTVEGGTEALFGESYGEQAKYVVGVEELQKIVTNLFFGDSRHWPSAYYGMATGISECVRFDVVLWCFLLTDTSIKLSEKYQLLIRNWSTVSKLWKLWCRYGIWNPEEHQVSLRVFADAFRCLSIVLDVDIAESIGKLSGIGIVAVDADVL
ncbi:uncharacterized protein LOC141642568 [Silene latifolia]|uniref:uncharacterized protein LOC141642568 n=1 Tax=Silene latifolia TaxID=37657 RepID=UPI003D7742E7